jgi:hypothetical protein
LRRILSNLLKLEISFSTLFQTEIVGERVEQALEEKIIGEPKERTRWEKDR